MKIAGLASATLLLATLASATEVPRTANGKPDFNGIWQAQSSAFWNVEPRAASQIPAAADGLPGDAFAAARGSVGIVEGGFIPYRDDARAQQKANFLTQATSDPARNCFMPGVPRANYMPYPLQIVQIPDHLFIAYEFAQASRTLYIDRPNFEAPVDTWMGHSLARWDGDTLVVDVTSQVGDTWLDRAGNFHSPALHVEERYTLLTPHHLRYEATLTDAAVYIRPWSLSVILYKNIDPREQILDFKCVEFVEDRMYGNLSKPEQRKETRDE